MSEEFEFDRQEDEVEIEEEAVAEETVVDEAEEEESRWVKIDAIDNMEEFVIDVQKAAQKFTEAEFRKFKGLMQIYFRNW